MDHQPYVLRGIALRHLLQSVIGDGSLNSLLFSIAAACYHSGHRAWDNLFSTAIPVSTTTSWKSTSRSVLTSFRYRGQPANSQSRLRIVSGSFSFHQWNEEFYFKFPHTPHQTLGASAWFEVKLTNLDHPSPPISPIRYRDFGKAPKRHVCLRKRFLLQSVYVLSLVAQSCPTLCDPMGHSPPGSSVHGDSPGKNCGVGCHAASSRRSYQPWDGTQASSIAGGFFTVWATREAAYRPAEFWKTGQSHLFPIFLHLVEDPSWVKSNLFCPYHHPNSAQLLFQPQMYIFTLHSPGCDLSL